MATATERDYETEDQAQPSNGSTGLITRPQASLPPASLAEQQRAITEIQASLHPEVMQFMQGLPDGPIPFEYPAPDYRQELLDE